MTTTTVLMILMLKNMNPTTMAIMILLISVLSTLIMFKTSMTSWISFVLILTFSSGMMTLFMYTTSMTPNEKTKSNKQKKSMTLMILLSSIMMVNPTKSIKKSMKLFSNQLHLLLMMIVILTSMIAISMHGHNPNQTLSSSF